MKSVHRGIYEKFGMKSVQSPAKGIIVNIVLAKDLTVQMCTYRKTAGHTHMRLHDIVCLQRQWSTSVPYLMICLPCSATGGGH